jgi:hypothetical protein
MILPGLHIQQLELPEEIGVVVICFESLLVVLLLVIALGLDPIPVGPAVRLPFLVEFLAVAGSILVTIVVVNCILVLINSDVV